MTICLARRPSYDAEQRVLSPPPDLTPQHLIISVVVDACSTSHLLFLHSLRLLRHASKPATHCLYFHLVISYVPLCAALAFSNLSPRYPVACPFDTDVATSFHFRIVRLYVLQSTIDR